MTGTGKTDRPTVYMTETGKRVLPDGNDVACFIRTKHGLNHDSVLTAVHATDTTRFVTTRWGVSGYHAVHIS